MLRKKTKEPDLNIVNLQKLEEMRTLLHANVKKGFREYDSRNNPLEKQFKEHNNFGSDYYVCKNVRNRFQSIIDIRRKINKMQEEIQSNEEDSINVSKEVKYNMDSLLKDCTLVEEYLKDIVLYSNVKPKTAENGFIMSYTNVCEAWDTFFSKWKVPCSLIDSSNKEFFSAEKYYDIESHFFCDYNELKSLYISYLKVANSARNYSKEEFLAVISAKALHRYIYSVPTCINVAGIIFPQKK